MTTLKIEPGVRLTDGDLAVLDLLLAQQPSAITIRTVTADDEYEAWLEGITPAEP